jgi:hypothetical protein
MFFPAMSPLNCFLFLRIHPKIFCIHCQNLAELKDFTRGKNIIENRRQNFIKTVLRCFSRDLLPREKFELSSSYIFFKPGLKNLFNPSFKGTQA